MARELSEIGIGKAGKFSFKVPEGHADAGKKIEKAFEYREVENDADAQEVMELKKWSLKDLINEALKATARSNAYQTALLPYKATEVPEEDIVERMVRDYIRLGFSEEVARATVTGMLANRQPASE